MRSLIMRLGYTSLLVPVLLLAEPPADVSASQQATDSASAQASPVRALVLGEDADGDGVRDDVEASLAKAAPVQLGAPKPALADVLEIEFVEQAPSFPLRAEGWDQMSCQDMMAMDDEDFQQAERARMSRSTFDRRHPCESVKFPHLEHPKVIDTEPGITYQTR